MNIEEELNWRKECYSEFLKTETPAIVKTYAFQPDYVLIDVFCIEPKKRNILLPETMTEVERGVVFTSVAKVIVSTSNEYAEGDVVKLSDFKCSVFENADHDQWNSLSEKGTVKKLGQTPPKLVNKFIESFFRYVFLISPITGTKTKMRLFLVPKHEIIAKINNPNDLIAD
ncbi:MAG: hypothetical protein IT245_06725 [Bacteroidia bacterium]|nr:hypothetical protein [Bacteroidia bacterium]